MGLGGVATGRDAGVMLDDSLAHFWPNSLRPVVSTRPSVQSDWTPVIDVTTALIRRAYTLRDE